LDYSTATLTAWRAGAARGWRWRRRGLPGVSGWSGRRGILPVSDIGEDDDHEQDKTGATPAHDDRSYLKDAGCFLRQAS
jgi:hypothetical protein